MSDAANTPAPNSVQPHPKGTDPVDRIPVLDGLRGYAILVVMCTHFFMTDEVQYDQWVVRWFVRVLKSGWIGVDLFFILSGFLITTGLLAARGRPRYFFNFYGRRTLRIFPLYYGVLFCSFVMVPLFAPDADSLLGATRHNQAWLWLYLTNFAVVFFGGWTLFDGPLLHFGHFWSLAVEEHFYLFWPLVVRLLRGRWLIGGCLAFIFAGLAFRFHNVMTEGNDSTASYILTYCRMDTLATGALAAVLVQVYGLPRLRPAATAGMLLGGLALCWLFVDEYGLRPTGSHLNILSYSLLAVFFASLLVFALAAQESYLVRLLFANRVMVSMGKYSYGLYVYHGLFTGFFFTGWLSVEAIHRHVPSLFLSAVVRAGIWLALSYALAFVSWHAYEKQCLKWKRHFSDAATQRSLSRMPATSHST